MLWCSYITLGGSRNESDNDISHGVQSGVNNRVKNEISNSVRIEFYIRFVNSASCSLRRCIKSLDITLVHSRGRFNNNINLLYVKNRYDQHT